MNTNKTVCDNLILRQYTTEYVPVFNTNKHSPIHFMITIFDFFAPLGNVDCDIRYQTHLPKNAFHDQKIVHPFNNA